MTDTSTYMATQIINWLKSTAFPADPAAIYVALYDGDPGDAGAGGTDVTTTIDATGRKAVTFGSITTKGAANTADVDFGLADAGASVSHFGIWDASSAGNLLYKSALAATKTVTTGDPVKFLTGDLTIQF